MKPAPPETAELLHRVRQQLLLAQVRIMELEDVRDELSPRLAETAGLLAAAQTLADTETDKAGHLATTLSGLQAQYEHMRHMQHVTNEALNDTRRQLEETTAGLAETTRQRENLRADLAALTDRAAQLESSLRQRDRDLGEAQATAAKRLEYGHQRDQEIRALRASRSWRWTAWLRALERFLGGRKS